MSASDLPPLPDDVAALLHAERDAPGPSVRQRNAVLQRVGATVAAGAVLTSASAASGVTAGLGLAAKITLAGLLLVGSAAGVRVLTRPPATRAVSVPVAPRVAAPAAPSRASAPTPVAPLPAPSPALVVSPALPVAQTVALPAVLPAVVAAAVTPRAPGADEDADLGAEGLLLDRAREALVARDASGALAALRSHRARFSRGRLAQERDALEVQALALGGQSEAARRAAERFTRAHPTSALLPVVERAVQDSP